MTSQDNLELFFLKCAALKLAVDEAGVGRRRSAESPTLTDLTPSKLVDQFSSDLRDSAVRMAEQYKVFYMLENDIRRLIDDTLSEAYGHDWWDLHSPPSAKEECRQNQLRENEAGFTSRSENALDYVSFGQLGEIIRHNYKLFGGILSNQKALGRVMYSLNNLRGPIAHCGILAEDEIDRLNLTVKDWFRLLEGPK